MCEHDAVHRTMLSFMYVVQGRCELQLNCMFQATCVHTLLDEVAHALVPSNIIYPLCGLSGHAHCIPVVDCEFGVLHVDLALPSLVW